MDNEIFNVNNFNKINDFSEYEEKINPYDQFLNVLEENEISASIKIKNVGVAMSGNGVTVHVGRSKKKQTTSLLEAKKLKAIQASVDSDDSDTE